MGNRMTKKKNQETPLNEPLTISLTPEECRKKRLFVATPMYGGMSTGMFTKSIADLAAKCQYYGISLALHFLSNESLIPRARNYCCINRDAQILTEHGLKSMGDIVDSKYYGKVATYDKDGNFSWERVINWSKRPNTESKKWVMVKNGSERTKKRLICTEDHRIATVKNIFDPKIEFVEAKDAIDQFLVRYPNEAVNNRTRENRLYNSEQLSVLVGSVLGDSTINKNGTVVYGHGPKQHEYAEYKGSILNATMTDSFGYSGFSDDDNYHCKVGTVKTNAQTKELRKLFYPNGTKTVTNILSLLSWTSLAFWYMDDGYLWKSEGKSDRAILCTQGFSKEDNELLVSVLNSRFGIECNVSHNSITNKFFISCTPRGTEVFFENIAPYVHESLQYKLSDSFKEHVATKTLNTELLQYSAAAITDIVYLEKNDSRTGQLYDITVEKNHNFIANGSLVHNCDEFMRSDATHLMFIDADIGFNPDDVLALLTLQSDDSPYDVIGGPYPKKCISWEKIKMAVDKGFADENPENLSKFVGDYVFNPKGDQREIPLGRPVEVLEIGTGFMMIRRKTMETFIEKFPQYYYKPDHVRTEHFDGSREIMQFFQAEIDPVSKRYLSEDYWFCVDGQAQIITPTGIRTLKSIVDSKYTGNVLSLNPDTGEKEWKPVLAHMSRANGKRGIPVTKKEWVTFDTDCDNNTKSKPKVTSDHRVAYFDNVFNPKVSYIRAENMAGKYMLRNPQRSENVLYSKDQVSALIGTLMGDSSIGKQGQLTCQHSDTQEDYINLKAKLFGGKVAGPIKQTGFGEGKFKYVMHAPVNAQTRKLRELMYDSSGKKTVANILHMIDEKALAFWYMDDGSIDNAENARLSTNGFSVEDNGLIKHTLKQKFDLDVVIDEKKVVYEGQERRYPSLRMNKDSSQKFFEMISQFIPAFMKHKLPSVLRNTNKWFDYGKVKSLDFAASFVRNIKVLPKHSSRLYDIEVADNHNFFASGTLVHNCQKLQEIGMKTYLCPWMSMFHVGTYIFGGSLVDLAHLGAPATADAGLLTEIRKKSKK